MSYNLIIVLTFIGFMILAAILLVPVYRFLKREEQVSSHWTAEELQRQLDARKAADRSSQQAERGDA